MIAHAETTTTTPKTPTAFAVMETTCGQLRFALDAANKLCDQIDRERAAIMAKHRTQLERLMEAVANRETELTRQINDHRHLFPDGAKTQTFSGIEVGFVKSRDTVEIPDETTLIKRIETMLPEKKDVLIDTKKFLMKAAFKKLAWAIKQKLGCSETKGADQLVIRLAKDDARKRAGAYLTEAASVVTGAEN